MNVRRMFWSVAGFESSQPDPVAQDQVDGSSGHVPVHDHAALEHRTEQRPGLTAADQQPDVHSIEGAVADLGDALFVALAAENP